VSHRIIVGDAREHLARFEPRSVQTCITSPPYFGLRDYGHDRQIGLEQTPEDYIESLVGVFREVRRVLTDDGTLWLNLGDSYAGSNKKVMADGTIVEGAKQRTSAGTMLGSIPKSRPIDGLKPKDLIGIPWRVAFALQADGWYLRSDIIWHKPNPMPESVTDRPTKSHEYLFLLTKNVKYYYNHEAIKEPAIDGDHPRKVLKPYDSSGGSLAPHTGLRKADGYGSTRNKRDVWTINTKPFKGAHFAVMPEALVEPCILAGSQPEGKRCDCDEVIATPIGTGIIEDPTLLTGRAGMNRPRRDDEGTRPITRREQRGHAEQLKASPHRDQMEQEAGPAFAHYIRTDKSGARPVRPALLDEWIERGWISEVPACDHPSFPADLVLDPFTGSGTVGVVAKRHGREFVGVELNPQYAEMAEQRITGEPESPFAASKETK
jgi:DNA modification methylase